VASVAVVLFDAEGEIFAGEELILWDTTVITRPIVG